MSHLALFGGTPVRTRPFPGDNAIGREEKRAVIEVLDSGVLSRFLGSWGPEFYGGPRVRTLEREWAEHFSTRHAISMNSATSALYAAVGAADVGPGDEVIVTPYTMTASVTGVLVYHATPVFADILPDTFCLDPRSVRRAITPRTRAIIVVDLFGHPAEMDEIMAVAAEHGLTVIEDAAQASGARYRGRYAGTLAHMGVFSLNYHKTIQSGEGGVVVTESDDLAERLQLIRNHAEAVVGPKGSRHLSHLVGFNYRMTEIEAAIAAVQLRRLETRTAARREAAARLSRWLVGLPGLTLPAVRPYAEHAYYLYAIRYDGRSSGIPRDTLVAALGAEGIPVTGGYVEPIYLQPIYHEGRRRHPPGGPGVSYDRGICPVTERLQDAELLCTDLCRGPLTGRDLNDVAGAFDKVFTHAAELAWATRTRRVRRSRLRQVASAGGG